MRARRAGAPLAAGTSVEEREALAPIGACGGARDDKARMGVRQKGKAKLSCLVEQARPAERRVGL